LKETVKHVIDVRWHEIAEAEEPAIVFYINAGLLTNEEEPKSGYQIMQIHAEPDISHLMGTRLVKVHPGNEAETHSSKRIFVDSCCWFLIVITG
jgi:hypothetical protein